MILIGLLGKILQPLQIDPVDHIPSIRERGLTLGCDRTADVVVVHVRQDDHLDVAGRGPALGKRTHQLAGGGIPTHRRRRRAAHAGVNQNRTAVGPEQRCAHARPPASIHGEHGRIERPVGIPDMVGWPMQRVEDTGVVQPLGPIQERHHLDAADPNRGQHVGLPRFGRSPEEAIHVNDWWLGEASPRLTRTSCDDLRPRPVTPTIPVTPHLQPAW
jgi:hypothetical protein